MLEIRSKWKRKQYSARKQGKTEVGRNNVNNYNTKNMCIRNILTANSLSFLASPTFVFCFNVLTKCFSFLSVIFHKTIDLVGIIMQHCTPVLSPAQKEFTAEHPSMWADVSMWNCFGTDLRRKGCYKINSKIMLISLMKCM